MDSDELKRRGTGCEQSWLAGLLVEQQILQGDTVYAFDPEGDYSSLASLPNTVVLGGGRLLPHDDDLMLLLQQGLSVILNHGTRAASPHARIETG